VRGHRRYIRTRRTLLHLNSAVIEDKLMLHHGQFPPKARLPSASTLKRVVRATTSRGNLKRQHKMRPWLLKQVERWRLSWYWHAKARRTVAAFAVCGSVSRDGPGRAMNESRHVWYC